MSDAVAATAWESCVDVPDEEFLIARATGGDQAAFGQLVSMHQAYVARLSYRLLGWPAEVEDVVQDVFLTAYRQVGGFRGRSSFRTWLAGIAVNRCRRQKRWRLRNSNLLFRIWTKDPAPMGQAAEHQAINSETNQAVRKAVMELPARDREVIVLRYLEEMPTAEIAAALGVAVNTAQVRLTRAKQKLSVILRQSEAIGT